MNKANEVEINKIWFLKNGCLCVGDQQFDKNFVCGLRWHRIKLSKKKIWHFQFYTHADDLGGKTKLEFIETMRSTLLNPMHHLEYHLRLLNYYFD